MAAILHEHVSCVTILPGPPIMYLGRPHLKPMRRIRVRIFQADARIWAGEDIDDFEKEGGPRRRWRAFS